MDLLIAVLAAVATGFFAYTALTYSAAPRARSAGLTDALRQWLGSRLGPMILARQPELVARFDHKLELVASRDLPSSGAEFLGANVGMALLVFVVMTPLVLLMGIGVPITLFLSLAFSGVILLFGTRRLDNLVTERTKALDRDFPYFLDFTVMTKRAGAVLIDSIRLFVESAEDTVLGREMRDLVNTKANGPGGLLGALDDYRKTCPSETGRNALMAIIAAEPVGASSATSLVSLASDMRHDRRQKAERAAETIKSSIMMPVTLMLVGVIIIILAGSLPALMSF